MKNLVGLLALIILVSAINATTTTTAAPAPAPTTVVDKMPVTEPKNLAAMLLVYSLSCVRREGPARCRLRSRKVRGGSDQGPRRKNDRSSGRWTGGDGSGTSDSVLRRDWTS